MAKINTLNYQTVASWNGSQDLFIVEQPDGTKVATPAMVKQFIEAGNFTATGEVEDGHGNILADMAKSADVATALAGKQDNLIVASGKLASTAGTIAIPNPTGVNKNDYYIVGWNIMLDGNKYSGYSMGNSGSQLSISMSDIQISVYNNDSTFYGAQIYIILAKM